MKQIFLPALLMAACAMSLAKLPAPDDATKAKAAEAAAKSAWQGKVDGYLLCKAQDKVAAHYARTAKAAPKDGKPAPAAAAAAAMAAPQAAAPAASTAAAAGAASGPQSGTLPAKSMTPTVVAAAAPATAGAMASANASAGAALAPAPSAAAVATAAPCLDPGPFANTLPEQKPLEASGAHSPPGTATGPPSSKTPAAAIAPAKKP